MVWLGHSETNIEESGDESDTEEVMGANIGGVKEWTVVEDQWLIRTYVNVGMDPIVGVHQKKSSI